MSNEPNDSNEINYLFKDTFKPEHEIMALNGDNNSEVRVHVDELISNGQYQSCTHWLFHQSRTSSSVNNWACNIWETDELMQLITEESETS